MKQRYANALRYLLGACDSLLAFPRHKSAEQITFEESANNSSTHTLDKAVSEQVKVVIEEKTQINSMQYQNLPGLKRRQV